MSKLCLCFDYTSKLYDNTLALYANTFSLYEDIKFRITTAQMTGNMLFISPLFANLIS